MLKFGKKSQAVLKELEIYAKEKQVSEDFGISTVSHEGVIMFESLTEVFNEIKEKQDKIIECLNQLRLRDEFKDNFPMAIGCANVELGFKQFNQALLTFFEQKYGNKDD